MKKIGFLVVLLVVLSGLGTVLSAADIQPLFNGNEKISVSMKQVWRSAMQSGNLLEETECMVKLNQPANKRVLKELRRAGLKTQTVLRTVVTGKIEVGDLPMLVSLDAVKSVDGGKRVFYK